MSVNEILQFKISLDGTRVWRRVQLSANSTFYEFHLAIQGSMGWLSCHLHHFFVINPIDDGEETIGVPDTYGFREIDKIPGNTKNISQYFNSENKRAVYEYDFGDAWLHSITFEKSVPKKEDQTYPFCLEGQYACPPEDVGGVEGFYYFCMVMKHPEHPEYNDFKEWITSAYDNCYLSYDPTFFDHTKVLFHEEKLRKN